jgi:N-acyl-L-homoserine lactone synthetase
MTIAYERKAGEAVNPAVSGEIFQTHPDAAYWIGRIAAADPMASNPDYYDALAQFRANVYVNQMGFLGPEHVDAFGRELDADDDRSVHFAVIENITNGQGPAGRIVGSGRLILKRTVEEPLPVEAQFPEIFHDNPIAAGSVEVSRFISRHPDQFTQHAIALAVIRAMSHYSVNNGVEADYCEIEKPLLKLLDVIGLPLEQLGEPKEVMEPGGLRKLYPIRINPYLILESVTKDAHDKIVLKEFFEKEVPNSGEGFYPANLIGGSHE